MGTISTAQLQNGNKSIPEDVMKPLHSSYDGSTAASFSVLFDLTRVDRTLLEVNFQGRFHYCALGVATSSHLKAEYHFRKSSRIFTATEFA